MVAPIIGGMTIAQRRQAESMIRVLKAYLKETCNDRARRQIALSIQGLAEDLVELPDGGLPKPPPPPPPKFTPPPGPE